MTPSSRAWLADLLGLGLVALAVRLVMARAVTVPPADDPAYYITVAANLHAGRGFVTDVIWQYHALPPAITHPAGDLWMPLPSILMALVFALTGSSWTAAQVPGILAGTGLALLTYTVGRQLLTGDPRVRILSVTAAVLVALNGVLAYQSASGDSSAVFSILAAGAIWLAGRRVGALPADGSAKNAAEMPGLLRSWAAAGVLIGFAYLARSDAVFVLCGLVTAAVLVRRSAPAWRVTLGRVAAVTLAAFAVAAPWFLRNAVEFGTPTPLPAGVLAGLTRYEELFNYTVPGSSLARSILDVGLALGLRAAALWHNWHQVLDFLFFPSAVFALIGLWLLRLRAGVAGALVALGVTLSATAILFPVPAMAGTFYHDAGAFAPWLAVGLVYLLRRATQTLARRRQWANDLLGLALLAFLVVTFAQLLLTVPAVAAQHRTEESQLREAAAYLAGRPAAPVISTSPYNLNLRTGLPGLMLPMLQEPAVVQALAERYGARFLVVFGSHGLYPGVLAGASDCGSVPRPGSGFCLAGGGDAWRIFELPQQ